MQTSESYYKSVNRKLNQVRTSSISEQRTRI